MKLNLLAIWKSENSFRWWKRQWFQKLPEIELQESSIKTLIELKQLNIFQINPDCRWNQADDAQKDVSRRQTLYLMVFFECI